MSIQFEGLGRPGRDYALLVQIDSGQSIYIWRVSCGTADHSRQSTPYLGFAQKVIFQHWQSQWHTENRRCLVCHWLCQCCFWAKPLTCVKNVIRNFA